MGIHSDYTSTPMRYTRKDITALVAELNERGALCNPPLFKFMDIRWQGRGYQLTIETANYGWQKFPKDDCSIRPTREFIAMLKGMLAMMPPAGK
jgi:hypothetical protein